MKKKREKVEDSVFMSQVLGLFLNTCLQKKCLLVQEKKSPQGSYKYKGSRVECLLVNI